MKKILYMTVLMSSLMLASEGISKADVKEADCLVLKDENSIICKYTFLRQLEDKEISFVWIDPDGEIARKRSVLVPGGHGSAYDFRYISGRLKGIWTFTVLDEEDSITTTFELN